eukprot:Hpha_TRINITY_DN15757_c1_g2::TRINITY_DN15757_c1_g2_i1::g.37550::m.37550
MAPNAFRDLHKFLRSHKLEAYADAFFTRGVRLENFHCLTKDDLARMRVTHSKTVRDVLNIAQRRTNLKGIGRASGSHSRDVLTPDTGVREAAEELATSLRTAQSAPPTAPNMTADSSGILHSESPDPQRAWTPTPAEARPASATGTASGTPSAT